MKWLFASDIHGSAGAAEKLLAAYDKEKAGRLILLGDLLYHGPRNDLPQGYAPKEVAAALNARKDDILCVRGNCEAEVDQMMLEFPVMADYAWLHLDGVDMFVTHGHVHSVINPPPLPQGAYLIHGHSHVRAQEDMGGFTYLNPGSVGIPRGDDIAGYMTLEGGVFTFKDMDGRQITPMDME